MSHKVCKFRLSGPCLTWNVYENGKISIFRPAVLEGIPPEKTSPDLGSDLVIFDEIQECPRAITSLKYFCEKLPELALCCAGSLLGGKLSSASFPVGKVDFLDLYPLYFAGKI